MNAAREILEQALEHCDTHAQALRDALEDLEPNKKEILSQLDDLDKTTRRILDQFAYRFTRLQDEMGNTYEFKWDLIYQYIAKITQ